VKFSFYLDSNAGESFLRYNQFNTTSGVYGIRLFFSNKNLFGGLYDYINATRYLDECTADAWHDVEIQFDHVTGLFTLIYDGVMLAEDQPMDGALTDKSARIQMADLGFGCAAWIDDFGIDIQGPAITSLAMETEGVELGLKPFAVEGVEQVLLYTDDLTAEWNVAERIPFFASSSSWVDAGSDDRTDPRDAAVSKRFYKITAAQPEPIAALPGYYVVGMKYYDTTEDTHVTRLSMYTFNADNTVQSKYWQWSMNETDLTDRAFASDRMIGNGIDDPPGNADEDKYMLGLSKQLGDESNLTTISGTWSRVGRQITVGWNDGTWEKWYITWEEPGNLYKIEAYDANYIQAGTNFYLTTSFGRDVNAVNAGWGFGGNTRDFNYARPIGMEMNSNHGGMALDYNSLLVPSALPVDGEEQNLASYFHLTDNDVFRYNSYNPVEERWIYHYFSAPVSNPGILARRMLQHTGHDFNQSGHIQDSAGHVHAGLQIIDGTGAYRGTVASQYMPQVWVTTRFWLVGGKGNDAALTGVLPE
jgi:hypothetical protein